MPGTVAVVHGVNLDMLGRRDPTHYGSLTLPDLERQIEDDARAIGFEARCFQTNHEGEFVEFVHSLVGDDDVVGVIVNPGAWTHYAYAIRDALELLSVPVVEVHLSDIERREAFRRQSVIADVAAHRIAGRGADGYTAALEWLAKET